MDLLQKLPEFMQLGLLLKLGAQDAGLMAYETITHIDDSVVADRDDFTEVMKDYSSGEVANFTVISSQDNDAETGSLKSPLQIVGNIIWTNANKPLVVIWKKLEY